NDGSHMSVATGSPQIPASVMGPTKRCADAVITGMTRAPALMHARATSTALYAAMLPVTARATVHPCMLQALYYGYGKPHFVAQSDCGPWLGLQLLVTRGKVFAVAPSTLQVHVPATHAIS